MKLAVFAVRVIVGALLLVAGALKVGHFADLATAIATFRLLPGAITAPLAIALPFFEILLGGYLLAGLFTRTAAWVACVQFVMYAGAIGSAVVRHLPANCGCFGPADAAPADWPHVAFDLALGALCAFIAMRAPGAFAIDSRFKEH